MRRRGGRLTGPACPDGETCCNDATGVEGQYLSIVYNDSPIGSYYDQAAQGTSSEDGGTFVDLPGVAPSAFAVVFEPTAVLPLNGLSVPTADGTGVWTFLSLDVPGDVPAHLWGMADLVAASY